MKRKELVEQHAECDVCRRKIGQTEVPLFYKVTVERFGLDARAIQRHTGLEMMLQSPALAAVMGPDEDLAMQLMEPTVVTVCETCSHEERAVMAALGKVKDGSDE